MAPDTPTGFRGLDRLQQMRQNPDPGVDPRARLARLDREYNVPAPDLLAGAVAEDGARQAKLRQRAWAAVARAVAREDARWGVLRDDPDDLPGRKEVLRAMSWADRLTEGAVEGQRATLVRAYGRGLVEGAARVYARQHHRIEQLDQLARADALRGRRNAAELEDLIDVARRDEGAAREQGPDAYALAVSWRSRLEDAADGLASERLEERAVELGRAGALDPRAALVRAREDLRTEAAGTDGLLGQAAERAAAQPLRLSRVRRALSREPSVAAPRPAPAVSAR